MNLSIDLTKGQRINLEKESPGLSVLKLGLGWDASTAPGVKFDADASILILGADDKALSATDFVFYKNKESTCKSVIHSGDNLTGDGEGFDEVITINLKTLPDAATRLLVPVTIHEATERNQNFGQINNASVTLLNDESKAVIAKYDLTEDYSTSTGVIFVEIYKKDGSWRAQAKGEGVADLRTFLTTYGL
jgi:tellurium resistance protein TerD